MNSKWYQTAMPTSQTAAKTQCTRSHSQRRAYSLSLLISLSLCSEQLLRQVAMGKDTKTKRDIIQKVIAYMTLGIDVSRLFSEMVLVRPHSTPGMFRSSSRSNSTLTLCAPSHQVSNTKSLVVKKMVFLYLCNYAATNPELTLLAINTLQKDWYAAAAAVSAAKPRLLVPG